MLSVTQNTSEMGKGRSGMEEDTLLHGPEMLSVMSLASHLLTLFLSPTLMADPRSYILSPGTNCQKNFILFEMLVIYVFT